MQSFAIIGMCFLAAITYGVIHDQITARICLEYFTIGHPRLLMSDSPTQHAMLWGVISTWWMGIGIGVVIVCAAQVGKVPPARAQEIIGPLLLCMLVLGLTAAIFGAIGRTLASVGAVRLVGDLSRRVPDDRHIDFLTVLWAHSASYLGGVVVTVMLAVRTWSRRRAPLTRPDS